MDPIQNQNTTPQQGSSSVPPTTPIPVAPPVEETQQMPPTGQPSNPVIPVISVEDETPVAPTPTDPVVPDIATPPVEQPVVNTTNPGEPSSPSDEAPKKSRKKFYTAIAGVVLLLVSIPLAIFLVQQNQEIRNKAAGSDPAHCGASDAKRYNGTTVEANCTGWDQTNNSCASDALNPYYYNSCTATGAPVADQAAAPQSQQTTATASNPDNADHCAASDGVRYSGGKPTNVTCDVNTYNSAKNNQCPGSQSENPYWYESCRNTGQNSSDAAHCAASDRYRYVQGKKTSTYCEGTWDQSNKSCQLDLENPYYYSSCGGGATTTTTATITSGDVQPRNVTKGQPLTFTAASTGIGTIHVRIWPNDAPGVTAIDGGKITGGNGSITYDTNKLPAGTTSAKIRFQAQDASGKDISGVAKDFDITVGGSSSLQVINASVTPTSPTFGDKVTFSAQLSGGTGMIHVRIWPNDAPGVTAVDGGKIGVGQTSVQYDTSALPKDTKTALVRFQAQDASGKDIGGVAKDITVTFLQAVAGDSRCTQIEMIRGGSTIFTSDAGNTAPAIKPGDQLTFKVYCFTADASDDYDYFRISVTKPDGTTLTQDPVAQRETSRDRIGNRFFSATYSLTADATGAYSVKAWGHMKKAAWKGAN